MWIYPVVILHKFQINKYFVYIFSYLLLNIFGFIKSLKTLNGKSGYYK